MSRSSTNPCPDCDGKGKKPRAKKPCPRCLGTGRGKPSRMSFSTLEAAEGCLQSARLDRLIGAGGPRMQRGSIIHEVLQRLAEEAYAAGRERWTEDEAVELAKQVLAAPQERAPLSKAVYDDVLAIAATWARTATIHPEAELFLTEHLFDHPVGEFRFSGKIDLVQVFQRDGVTIAKLDDYKGAPHVPGQEDYEAKLQSPYYAWGLHVMLPHVELFDVGEVYVQWGKRLSFPEPLTVDDFAGIEGYLTTAAKRIDDAWEANDHPATPDPKACDWCCAPQHCPLPKEVRPEAAIADDGEALKVMRSVLATKAKLAADQKAIKGYVKRDGAKTFTLGGLVAEFNAYDIESVKDKDAAKAALQEGGQNPDDFFKVGHRTDFKIAKAA